MRIRSLFANAISRIPVINIFLDKDSVLEYLNGIGNASVYKLVIGLLSCGFIAAPSLNHFRYFQELFIYHISIGSFFYHFRIELYFISVLMLIVFIYGKRFNNSQIIVISLAAVLATSTYLPLGMNKLKILKYSQGPISIVENPIRETEKARSRRTDKMLKSRSWRYSHEYLSKAKQIQSSMQQLVSPLENQVINLKSKYSPIELLDFLVFCKKTGMQSELVTIEISRLEKHFRNELKKLDSNDFSHKYSFSIEFKTVSNYSASNILHYDKILINNILKNLDHKIAIRELVNAKYINHWFCDKGGRILPYLLEVHDTHSVLNEPYLNFRILPNPKSPVLFTLDDGQQVELISVGHGIKRMWVKVKFQDKVAFAHSRYLRIPDSPDKTNYKVRQ